MLRVHTMSSKDVNRARALGRRIRQARTAKGMKQCELARRCGVLSTTAWRWEDGRIIPTLLRLQRISAETGADLGWLVGGDAA